MFPQSSEGPKKTGPPLHWDEGSEEMPYSRVHFGRIAAARTSRSIPFRVFDTADRIWIIRGSTLHWPS